MQIIKADRKDWRGEKWIAIKGGDQSKEMKSKKTKQVNTFK